MKDRVVSLPLLASLIRRDFGAKCNVIWITGLQLSYLLIQALLAIFRYVFVTTCLIQTHRPILCMSKPTLCMRKPILRMRKPIPWMRELILRMHEA